MIDPDPLPGLDSVRRSAELSHDGRYRYTLIRRWGGGPRVTFVMLNPSTADALKDDPTIRRCVGFARTWGYDALLVVNLYGLRAVDPARLHEVADPVGPDNDRYLADAFRDAHLDRSPVVCAWGTNGGPNRVRHVLGLAPSGLSFSCLTTTKAGHPAHPLYMRADLTPTGWQYAE